MNKPARGTSQRSTSQRNTSHRSESSRHESRGGSKRDAEHSLPQPPTLRRQIGAPLRLSAALVLTLALPIAAFAGLLGGGAEVPPVVPALRVALIFAALMFAFRVLGKRELGRLSPFELVTLMLVPEILSSSIQGEGSLVNGLVGLSTLLALVLITSVLAHRFEAVERTVEAQPTVLVAHGRMLHGALNAERIVPDELFAEMRKQGLADLDEVAWAVLENSGNITFVPERSPSGERPRARNPDDGTAPH
jgi:uncharacterized membrane protein YcaP (DUF421 family)